MKVAAIADLHCRANSAGTLKPLFQQLEQQADVIVLAGDLTDSGLPAEMEVLLEELSGTTRPLLAVLGNHDHEGDQAAQLVEMMAARGITVLDGTACEIGSTGFVGTKGFCGGFNMQLVQPFGEQALKKFILASIDEAVRLENALAKLQNPKKMAILHYAPIRETLDGESPELFAFLGSSRLANALDRHRVDLIVHGHAHHGAPSGRTPLGTPVYNVSRFVLLRFSEFPYRIFEL